MWRGAVLQPGRVQVPLALLTEKFNLGLKEDITSLSERQVWLQSFLRLTAKNNELLASHQLFIYTDPDTALMCVCCKFGRFRGLKWVNHFEIIFY